MKRAKAKILSALIAAAMVLGLAPVSALASDYIPVTVIAYDVTNAKEEQGGDVAISGVSEVRGKKISWTCHKPDTIVFIAFPDEGYTFKEWRIGSADGSVLENDYYDTEHDIAHSKGYVVPSASELTEIKAYALYEKIPAVHSITVNGGKAYSDEACTEEITSASTGAIVFLKFDAPPEGKYMSVTSAPESILISETKFKMPDENVTITAEYVDQIPYTVDMTAGPVVANIVDEMLLACDLGIVYSPNYEGISVYKVDLDKDGNLDVEYNQAYTREMSTLGSSNLSGEYKIIIPGAMHSPITFKFPVTYPVWVGGVQVTSVNKDDILDDGGKAKYDPDTKTLTLDDPAIPVPATGNGIRTSTGGDPGFSSLTIKGSATVPEGIFCRANLTIDADLTVNDNGIFSYNDTTILGGNVTVTSEDESGLDTANGGVTISGGTISVTGKKYGINSGGHINISGGDVTATGSEEAYGGGAGIYTEYNNVSISGGTVTAKGRVNGIFAGGNVIVSGDKLSAETWVKNESQAIHAGGDITIAKGTVETKTASTGIRSLGTIKIENGTEKVEADAKNHAVYAGTALEIGDGLMIKEPKDGTNDGNTVCESDGTTEAVYALIVPKETEPTETPTPTPEETATPTPTPEETATPTPKPEEPATPIPEETGTPAPAGNPESDGSETDKIVYTVISGGDSTFTAGNTDPVVITVKRSVDDDTCFSHFASVEIDGAALTATQDYDAKAGSTVVTLYASKLEQLSNGKHSVTVKFDDGKAETSVTVMGTDGGSEGKKDSDGGKKDPDTGKKEADGGKKAPEGKKDSGKQTVKPTTPTKAPASPKGSGKAVTPAAPGKGSKAPATGDNSSIWLWAVLMLAAASGGMLIYRKRTVK